MSTTPPTLTTDAIRAAAIRLLLKYPAFAPIIARLTYKVDPTVKTAGVTYNGTLYFAPECWHSIQEQDRPGVIAHECCHLIYDSFGRQGGRQHKLWNVATDMAINFRLKEMGVSLPSWVLVAKDGSETAEQIYARLSAEEQSKKEAKQAAPFHGTVTDLAGARVSGASVKITNTGETLKTNKTGAWAGSVNATKGSRVDVTGPGLLPVLTGAAPNPDGIPLPAVRVGWRHTPGAGYGTVCLTVADKQGQALPIPATAIHLSPVGMSLRTVGTPLATVGFDVPDVSGNDCATYVIANVAPGDYYASVSIPGELPLQAQVVVEAGTTTFATAAPPDGGAGEGEGDGEPSENPQPGAGCGVAPPDRGNDPSSGKDGDGSMTEEQLRREWRQAAEAARTIAQQHAGAGSNSWATAFLGLTDVPVARVPFARLVRSQSARALATAGRDEQVWSRRGRRSGEILLPGWAGKKVNLAIVIDTSGSMSDTDVSVACRQAALAAASLGVGIYLVIHDAAVGWSGWLHGQVSTKRVASKVNVRGGTMFAPAYNNVGEQKVTFDALIHLTDGGCCEPQWSNAPANVKRLVVGLVNDTTPVVPEGAVAIKVAL